MALTELKMPYRLNDFVFLFILLFPLTPKRLRQKNLFYTWGRNLTHHSIFKRQTTNGGPLGKILPWASSGIQDWWKENTISMTIKILPNACRNKQDAYNLGLSDYSCLGSD